GGVGVGEVAPALVGASGESSDWDELGVELDDGLAVAGADVEAEDGLAGGELVLDDPVDRAADQLVGALGAEAGDERHYPVRNPRLLAPRQSGDARAADRDLRNVQRLGG